MARVASSLSCNDQCNARHHRDHSDYRWNRDVLFTRAGGLNRSYIHDFFALRVTEASPDRSYQANDDQKKSSGSRHLMLQSFEIRLDRALRMPAEPANRYGTHDWRATLMMRAVCKTFENGSAAYGFNRRAFPVSVFRAIRSLRDAIIHLLWQNSAFS